MTFSSLSCFLYAANSIPKLGDSKLGENVDSEEVHVMLREQLSLQINLTAIKQIKLCHLRPCNFIPPLDVNVLQNFIVRHSEIIIIKTYALFVLRFLAFISWTINCTGDDGNDDDDKKHHSSIV